MDELLFNRAIKEIQNAQYIVAFTGAGISVESGIPAFRGPGGLWTRYDPRCLEIDYFWNNPPDAWRIIKEIFYDTFNVANPNPAHIALACLEQHGLLKRVITQNIDGLHVQAGNIDVVEFHGSSRRLICTQCSKIYLPTPDLLATLPPLCDECKGLLKPDFVFFGEPIPLAAYDESLKLVGLADLWLIIGTTGEVQPAAALPRQAKRHGARIIEVNVQPSTYTPGVTDIFLQGRAGDVLEKLAEALIK